MSAELREAWEAMITYDRMFCEIAHKRAAAVANWNKLAGGFLRTPEMLQAFTEQWPGFPALQDERFAELIAQTNREPHHYRANQ